MAVAEKKITFRLNMEKDEHRRALKKIETSPLSAQAYILEAVLAYDASKKSDSGITRSDAVKIAEQIMWRMREGGFVYSSRDLRPVGLTEDKPEEQETQEKTDEKLAFLDGLIGG